jgi:hypothetical protein
MNYPASLLSVTEHNDMLLEVLELPVSIEIFREHARSTKFSMLRLHSELVAEVVTDAVDHAFSQPRSLDGPSQSLIDFVSRVLLHSQCPMAPVLLTLAYIRRSKRYLQIALEDWACERVFLGAFVVAAKYSNDVTPKNKFWAQCTGVFSTTDVNRVEREFLNVMAFQLSITESELLPFIWDVAAASGDLIAAKNFSPITVKPKPKQYQDDKTGVTFREGAHEAAFTKSQRRTSMHGIGSDRARPLRKRSSPMWLRQSTKARSSLQLS